MAQTAPGATRKRPAAEAASTPALAARVADLRAHVAKTEAALERAREWDEEQYTTCSGENLREAKFEHGLAKSGLRRAEAALAEAQRRRAGGAS